MALSTTTSTQQIPDPNNRYNYYDSQMRLHTPSPSESTTPSTLSLVSPRDQSSLSPSYPPQIPRQLRPPRVPNYVPAVLRPTDAPSRQHSYKNSVQQSGMPISPPSSGENSFNGPGDPLSPESHFGFGGRISRVVTDEWNEDMAEVVTGAPTRDHWKPDASTVTCDAAVCTTQFSLFQRRHHCRRCGNIYCATHSPHAVLLDQHARFHPHGYTARACDNCWTDFAAWRRMRVRTSSSSSVGSDTSSVDQYSQPQRTPVSRTPPNKEAIASSVPRDWSWSTF